MFEFDDFPDDEVPQQQQCEEVRAVCVPVPLVPSRLRRYYAASTTSLRRFPKPEPLVRVIGFDPVSS